MEAIKKLFIAYNNGKYGLIDETDNIILNTEYDNIIQFGNDTYAIEQDSTYQLYDSNINLIFDKHCKNINYIPNEGYIYSLDINTSPSLYGFISEKGEDIVEPDYHFLKAFNLAKNVWYILEKKYEPNIFYIYNRKKELIGTINPEHKVSSIKYCGSNLFYVSQSYEWEIEKCGFQGQYETISIDSIYDYQGNEISAYSYDGFESFEPYIDNIQLIKDNLFIAQLGYGEYQIVDNRLNNILQKTFDSIKYAAKDILSVSQITKEREKIFYYCDFDGNNIYDRNFKYCSIFRDGLAFVVELNNWKGLINIKGEQVHQFDYKIITNFENEYAIATDINDFNYFLINKEFKILYESDYFDYDLRRFNLFFSSDFQRQNIKIINLIDNSFIDLSKKKYDIRIQKYCVTIICEDEVYTFKDFNLK